MKYPYFIAEFKEERFPGLHQVVPMKTHWNQRTSELRSEEMSELLHMLAQHGIMQTDAEFYFVFAQNTPKRRLPNYMVRQILHCGNDDEVLECLKPLL